MDERISSILLTLSDRMEEEGIISEEERRRLDNLIKEQKNHTDYDANVF